jgi:hypothetical protein
MLLKCSKYDRHACATHLVHSPVRKKVPADLVSGAWFLGATKCPVVNKNNVLHMSITGIQVRACRYILNILLA